MSGWEGDGVGWEGDGVGWVVAKAKTKMQSDTIIEFRVVMTCMNPERANILFHYKALIDSHL